MTNLFPLFLRKYTAYITSKNSQIKSYISAHCKKTINITTLLLQHKSTLAVRQAPTLCNITTSFIEQQSLLLSRLY